MKKYFFLLLALISFFSVSSFSETIPASSLYCDQSTPTACGDSVAAAAAAFAQSCASTIYNGVPSQCVITSVVDTHFYYTLARQLSAPPAPMDVITQGPRYAVAQGYSCPAGQNWTLSGSSCTRVDCVAPATRLVDGTCGRDCNSIKGSSYSGYIPAGSNPATVCQDGCNATVVSASNQASVGGVQVIAGSFSYSGGSCTGNDITGGTPPVCPAGQCVGLINGANSCFTCSDINKSATTYTATSDTTFKTTTYNADSTTTTAVTDTSTGTTSPSQAAPKSDQQTYCEQNPTAVSCLDTQNEPAPVEPSLDTTPTGASIFSGIKDYVQIQPSNFSHVSQCPISSFDWNGRTFVFNQHCALVTDHWAILSTAMLTAWTVLSLFVVLKA